MQALTSFLNGTLTGDTKTIARELVYAETALATSKATGEEVDRRKLLTKLHSKGLPNAWHEPLRRILAYLEDFHFPQVATLFHSNSELRFTTPPSFQARTLALKAALYLEGELDNSKGLMLMHSRKDFAKALDIIREYVEEFQSRRRSFIFVETSHVEIENYKMVMLYALKTLNNPELEAEVRAVSSIDELDLCLKNFKAFYTPHHGSALSTLIHPYVFDLASLRKPIPSEGTPKALLDLITKLEIDAHCSPSAVFAPLNALPDPNYLLKPKIFAAQVNPSLAEVQAVRSFILEKMVNAETFDWANQGTAVRKALSLITALENALAEKKPEFIRPIAVQQGLLPHVSASIETERNERMVGYKKLRRYLANHPDYQNRVDEAVHRVLSGFNSGVFALLDSAKSSGLGIASLHTECVGTLRFFPEKAQEGDIVVLKYAPESLQPFLKASALITQEGGLFSHTALLCREYQLPGLFGCDIESLRGYEGKRVHLKLSDTPSLSLEIPTVQPPPPARLPSPYKTSLLVGKSGKKENLDRLQSALSAVSTSLILEVPPYTAFHANELFWPKMPALKTTILKILNSDSPNKTERIQALFEGVSFDFLEGIDFSGDLIVRSSGALEDQLERSAAGIFTSVRIKADPQQAFKEVLLSAFSEKALSYFSAQERELLFDMTWILQRHVSDGEYSGVALSVADKRKWKIAGLQLVKGLGGGVEGKGMPSHLFVDTQKNYLTDIHGTPPCPIPIAKEIALVTKQLEVHFQTPLEIEFVGKENRLSIVQMRPLVLKV